MKNSQKQKNSVKADYIKVLFDSDEVNKNYTQNEVFKIYIQKLMLNSTYTTDLPQSMEIFKEKICFSIIDYQPKQDGIKGQQVTITESTKIVFDKEQKQEAINIKKIHFILDNNIFNELRQIIDLNLLSDEQVIFPQKFILIQGNSKSGKTWIVDQVEKEYEQKIKIYHFKKSNFTKMEFISDKEMKQKQPFILIIDQLTEKTDFFQLENLFQRQKNFKCLTLATVNSQDKIEFLEKNEIFDKIFFTQYPNQFQRQKFLEFYLRKLQSELQKESLTEQLKDLNFKQDNINQFAENLSLKSPGFSFKDLQNLIQEIQLKMFIEKQTSLNNQILQKAFENVIPQQVKEKPTKNFKITFDNIGGYKDLKNKMKTLIQLPLLKPELFLKKGLRPSKGILLYGPPGCSKTMFAKALATDSNMNFLSIKGPEIFNKYVGDSEKNIRDIFRKARLCAPTIIFFDEIDAIARKRGQSEVSDRILTQLLTEIDGVDSVNNIIFNIKEKEKCIEQFQNNLVIVIGATNRPEILDSAILRPGRFDQLLFVDLPDQKAVLQILNIETSKYKLSENVDLESLALQMQNYTGAEVVQVCKEAAMESIYQQDYDREEVTLDDFCKALSKVHPRIDQQDI